MHILCLETSTKNLSLAILKDGKILRFRNIVAKKILESSLVKSIDKLLIACSLDLHKIDVVAVGLGPGSFTSLRVGLATLKAFALALNKKVIGVCSLDLIAASVSDCDCDEICVLVDAYRGNVHAAIYDKSLKLKTKYELTTLEEILKKVKGKTLFVGDALGLYDLKIKKAYRDFPGTKKNSCKAILAPMKFWYPQAKELAKISFQRAQKHQYDDPERLTPIYLYPQDCQVHKK